MILVDNHFQFHLPDSNTIILWVEMDLASSAACSTTSSCNHACLEPPHRRAGCGPATESKQLWRGIPPHTCTRASHDGAAGMAVPNSPLAVTDVIPHPSGPLSLRTGLGQRSCFPPSLQAADWQMHSRGKLSLFLWLSFAPPEGFSSLRLLLRDFPVYASFLLPRYNPVGVVLFYSAQARPRGIIHVSAGKRCKSFNELTGFGSP